MAKMCKREKEREREREREIERERERERDGEQREIVSERLRKKMKPNLKNYTAAAWTVRKRC